MGDRAVMKPTSLKRGDRFKDRESGEIYILKTIFGSHSLLLEGENGKGRRITGEGTLRRTCDKMKDRES